MKANELMIGDWVLDKAVSDKPVQIEQINEQNVHYKRGNGYMSAGVELLEPVPLTAEILYQNGFELREGCTTAWDWHNGEQSVHISGDHTCPIGQTVTIYTPGGCVGAAFSSHRTLDDHKIRGVHELQHALRLCHINMEIKIKEE